MAIELSNRQLVASLALSLLVAGRAVAGNPTPAEALAFQPVQKDVQIDRPEVAEIPKCTIKAEKMGGKTGWVVRDASGQILRNFVDTNGDNTVDQWSYYKDGVEVYRDIDSNFNRKVDQFRWLNTAGTRWAVDTNEDGKIDAWKAISAEEATAELVAALRDRDRARFERLLLSAKDLKALGIGPQKSEQLQKKIEAAGANFAKLSAQQKIVTPATKWVSFAAAQPGTVPTGTEDSTADLCVYENAMAMVDTEGKAHAIAVGALVRIKDAWRLIDVPQIFEGENAQNETRPFFFASPRNDRAEQPIGKTNEKIQNLMAELQKLGEINSQTSAAEHDHRAQILESIIKEAEPETRPNWYKQLADTLSAQVQTGNYPKGIERLKELYELLQKNPQDEELAFYVQFRYLTAEHGQALAAPDAPFADIQKKWVDDLKSYVEAAKHCPDSADAMMELAIAQEFGGDEEEALKWYDKIVENFPKSPLHRKAEGAKLRLSSVGKSLPLQGKLIGGQNFDVGQLKGKVVLIQYWATWCQPCKADMPLLKDLRNRFKGFEVVGVCLDNDKKEMQAFLEENDPHWPQLYEEGGLENRLAISLGIQTLPTMILLDKQGRVVNRNVRAQELEAEVKKLLK
jgi:thiol-disulfide isomerase/thioredoxin